MTNFLLKIIIFCSHRKYRRLHSCINIYIYMSGKCPRTDNNTVVISVKCTCCIYITSFYLFHVIYMAFVVEKLVISRKSDNLNK